MSLRYSEIKNHIINGKSLWMNGIILFLFVVLIYLSYIIRKDFSFSVVIFITIIIYALFILSILMNLHKCHHFYKSYKNELDKGTVRLCKIVTKKNNYKAKVPLNSYDMEILSMPKSTNAIYIESADYLLLFFSIQYMGVFQQVLNPLMFILKKDNYLVKDKKTIVISDFEIIEVANNKIIDFANKNLDIQSIILLEKY